MIKGWQGARRIATAIWLAGVALQFVIWVLMCLIGRHLADPFWLWTAAVGGVVVGGMWAVPVKGGARG